jgi:dephospho-CoA kinase
MRKMIVIGLTGGIGAGKSTAAKILARAGLPVYNADKAVHKLLGPNGVAVKKITKLFPGTLKGKSIDRQALGKIVFGNSAQLRKLEKILHPLVQKTEISFLAKARRKKAPAAVLEIPLLFETGAEARCDIVILVTAPLHIRKARTLERKGMTAAKFRAITKAQMPESEKRRRADYIVPTAKGLRDTERRLEIILSGLLF